MTVRLAVAGAFHTHFMKPAEEKLRCAVCPVHSCFTPVEQASCVSKCCSCPCLLVLPSLNGIGNTHSVNFVFSCLKTIGWLLRRCSAVREALASSQIVEPRIPVVSNVDAKAHCDPEAIRDILARQVNTCNPCLHTASQIQMCNALAAIQYLCDAMLRDLRVTCMYVCAEGSPCRICKLDFTLPCAADIPSAVGEEHEPALGQRPRAEL